MSYLGGYGGRQANKSSYIKLYNNGINNNMAYWYYVINNGGPSNTITPYVNTSNTNNEVNVYMPNNLTVEQDLTVNGIIHNPSDIKLKKNIKNIDSEACDKLLNIQPKEYDFIHENNTNTNNSKHFGFIAQEIEEYFPNLVKESKNIINGKEEVLKTVNYLEIIPLLLLKIQNMQKEINELKYNYSINNNNDNRH